MGREAARLHARTHPAVPAQPPATAPGFMRIDTPKFQMELSYLQICLQHAAAARVLCNVLQLARRQRRHRVCPLLAGSGWQAQQRGGHGAAEGGQPAYRSRMQAADVGFNYAHLAGTLLMPANSPTTGKEQHC